MTDFAILAPFPFEHLDSAYREVVPHKEYVSGRSQKWELFRQVDELRDGEKVPVLIYPSHEETRAELSFNVAWIGWYIGHVVDMSEKMADLRNGHRPPTTDKYPDDRPENSALFWRIEGLRPLPEDQHVSIGELETLAGHWRKNRPPRGPEIVACPTWFNDVMASVADSTPESETPDQPIAAEAVDPIPASDLTEPPDRIPTVVNRIVRDTAIAQALKKQFDYKCQLCGTQLQIGPERHYTEVHHIRPLGDGHEGADVAGNMLVLCPNHHAQFDYGLPKFNVDGSVTIGTDVFMVDSHPLDPANLEYHNSEIHGRESDQ